MKRSWTQETDVHNLHKQGYRMTTLYWKERDERIRCQAVIEALRKQLKEAFYATENVEVRQNEVQDMLDVTFTNYKNLSQTLEILTQKEDNTPLNNEMAQIKEILENSAQQQHDDVEQLKIRHAKIVSQLNNERKNQVLEYENHGLEIKLAKEKMVKEVTVSTFNNLVDAIVHLSQKESGEPLNNEMAQINHIVQDSKKTYAMEMARVEIDYSERLKKMYENCNKNNTK